MEEQSVLLTGHFPSSGWLRGFVFCGAVFAYSFNHPGRLRRWVALGMGRMAFLYFWKIPEAARWVALAPLSIWLLYYGFQKPGRSGLRAIPLLKPLAIALAWTWVTVLLPLDPKNWDLAWLLLPGRAVFVFALALAYDLCDPAFDRRQGLVTLAAHLGVARTFRLIDVSLLLSACCAAGNYWLDIYPLRATLALWISLLCTALLLRPILRLTAVERKKMYIDGLMILQYLLVLSAVVWGD